MFPPSVPSVAASAVPAGAHIVDVREDDEWDAGHVEGAQHIPLADVPARLDEIPADAERLRHLPFRRAVFTRSSMAVTATVSTR